jgi:glycosyltransferase involved in cell wall biosynthesis
MSNKLSILVPNYNGGENLQRALESCENLSLPEEDYKITVIDNQSGDNSVELVKELQEEKENIELIQNEENLGRIGNWNKSIEVADGEYSLFLFVNEQIAPSNNIDELIKNMDKENVNLAKSRFLPLSKSNKTTEDSNDMKKRSIGHKIRKDVLLKGRPGLGPLQTFVVETETMKESKFTDKYEIIGDQDYIVNLARHLENKNNDQIILTKSQNIIWDDEDKERFHNSLDNVDLLEETVAWYRNENIASYSKIPLSILLTARLSEINILELYGEDRNEEEKDLVKNALGKKYPIAALTSYFYPPMWYRKVTGII